MVHPGGPYWRNKDLGTWSIPKGEFTDEELPLDAAKREFSEETGAKVEGEFTPLTRLVQKSGKLVMAWAVEADIDANNITSNVIEIEWPPHSGRKIKIPEADRAGWFAVDEARAKIVPGQAGFISELVEKLKST